MDDPDRALKDAATNALNYLIDCRRVLLNSYCLKNPRGTPVRTSARGADAAHLREIEAVIEPLATALIHGSHLT